VLFAASTSSIFSRLVCHPLDTLRLRIQTYPSAKLPPLAELIPKPAIRGLYAGLPVALTIGIPALSVYLSAYEGAKAFLSTRIQNEDGSIMKQLPVFLAAGMTAEVASAAIWTPMDVVKSRLQKGEDGTNSARVLIRRIWREEGYRGVFRGYWMSIAVWGPQVSFYWMLYESLKTRFIPGYTPASSRAPSPSVSGLSEESLTLRYLLTSSAACAISVTVTNPIDAVQARWQTSGGKAGGLQDIVRTMWRIGGTSAFLRGIGARIVYTIPANAISMTTYELVKRNYQHNSS